MVRSINLRRSPDRRLYLGLSYSDDLRKIRLNLTNNMQARRAPELCGVALRGETLKKNGFLTKVLVILLPFAALGIMYFIAKLVSENITFPECGIYKILNIYCPGCGITRAAEALARGDILLSLRQNAFPVFILTVGLLFYIELLFWAFGKRVRLPVHSLKFVYIALIFWGVYVVARNLISAIAPV